MGIDIAGSNIETEIKTQTPYQQLDEYIKTKGVVAEREVRGRQRKVLEFSRWGALRTHLSLPIIGDTDYKGIDFKITKDLEEPDSDIKIEISDKEATEKAAKKGSEYPSSIITITAKGETTMIIDHPNDLWRWLGLNSESWQDGSEQESFITGSSIEAQKVVDSFTKLFPMWGEEENTDAPLYSERVVEDSKISRRSFLRLLSTGAKLAIADSVLAHIPGTPSLTKGFWEKLETLTVGVPPEEWKKYIEAKMGVHLISPSTGTSELTYHNRKFGALEWEAPQLKILYSVLSDLPEHFYKGKKVDVALVDQFKLLPTNIYAQVTEGGVATPGGYCVCHNPDNQLVVLNKIAMGQTFFEAGSARDLITHEFTHKVTLPNLNYYVNFILVPIGISQPEQLRDIFKVPIGVRTLTFGALGRQGYGATNFSEFFSVAAEYYIGGKGSFNRFYMFFLGQENTEKLYEGIKKEIFAGKEY